MSSCATQKKLTFWGGWKNSLIFLNNLSVDHMGQGEGGLGRGYGKRKGGKGELIKVIHDSIFTRVKFD